MAHDNNTAPSAVTHKHGTICVTKSPLLHESPLHPFWHVHVLGDVHVPPFSQLGVQTAEKSC